MKKHVLVVVASLCLSFGLLSGCHAEEVVEPDFSGVESVCELASLQCYYHNVAKVNIDGWWPFEWGAKRLWMEYDGIVKYGIDVGQVRIEPPDDQGVVRVHMPEVQVLSVYLDSDSFSEPYDDSGIFPWDRTSIEQQTKAIAQAQEDMRNMAVSDNAMLHQASLRARNTLEGYVKNVGDVIGAEYEVEWA